MENTNAVSQMASYLNTSVFKQIIGKLSSENITTIIVSAIAAGTVCYVCSNGGSLELSYGDKKVVLNSGDMDA